MTSHQAFRRDLGRFARAVRELDPARIDALRGEWTSFRETLHHHHVMEDTGIFPDLKARFPAVAPAIDHLANQHARIDPLLDRGDRAFAALPETSETSVLAELATLLDAHLDMEEAVVIPSLRGAKEFPLPPDDNAAAMYADGFAWSTQGIAPDVIEKINAMLPAVLVEKLPAAVERFAARCVRVWGSTDAGATTTSVPS